MYRSRKVIPREIRHRNSEAVVVGRFDNSARAVTCVHDVVRYTGYGAAGKWEPISQGACPNFREDLNTYLSTAGSNSKSLLVGNCLSLPCLLHALYPCHQVHAAPAA